MWDAPWRAAPDRIMPGTSAGSAPQEAWHKHVVKAMVTTHNQTPFGLAAQLQDKVLPAAFKRLSAFGEGCLPDWPSVGTFLDQCVLKSDAVMGKVGRACAHTLMDLGLTRRHVQDGNTWLMIPTSTWKKDFEKSTKKVSVWKKRNVAELAAGSEQSFYKLCTAVTETQACEALSALGVYCATKQTISEWKLAARLFDDWRCVWRLAPWSVSTGTATMSPYQKMLSAIST